MSEVLEYVREDLLGHTLAESRDTGTAKRKNAISVLDIL